MPVQVRARDDDVVLREVESLHGTHCNGGKELVGFSERFRQTLKTRRSDIELLKSRNFLVVIERCVYRSARKCLSKCEHDVFRSTHDGEEVADDGDFW